jgi:hypothetical protein
VHISSSLSDGGHLRHLGVHGEEALHCRVALFVVAPEVARDGNREILPDRVGFQAPA